MASFAKARDELLVAYDEGTIDAEEFVLSWEQNDSKNPSFPYKDYEKFDLAGMDPVECNAEFRFEKNDFPSLAEALQIPDTFFCQQRSVCDGTEGLCMALKRFSYPCRYSDMIPRFAKLVPVLSMITNTVVDFISNMHGHRIMQWNNFLLDQESWNSTRLRLQRRGQHWITAMDSSMVLLGQYVDLEITKGLSTMATE